MEARANDPGGTEGRNATDLRRGRERRSKGGEGGTHNVNDAAACKVDEVVGDDGRRARDPEESCRAPDPVRDGGIDYGSVEADVEHVDDLKKDQGGGEEEQYGRTGQTGKRPERKREQEEEDRTVFVRSAMAPATMAVLVALKTQPNIQWRNKLEFKG